MAKELKAVVDTNVFVSGLVCKAGIPAQIFQAFTKGRFCPLLSLEMRVELLGVINRPEFRRYFNRSEINHFEKLIKTDSILVSITTSISVCRDPKDNIILECAISSPDRPDCIVTGDKDLLSLQSFHNIPIIKPRDFLKRLK